MSFGFSPRFGLPCLLLVLALGSCREDAPTNSDDQYLGEVHNLSATGTPPGIVIMQGTYLDIRTEVVDKVGRLVQPQPTIMFSTDNPSIASVTSAGRLTANTAGVTSIKTEVTGSASYRPSIIQVFVVQFAAPKQ
jgi:hypothetical protein